MDVKYEIRIRRSIEFNKYVWKLMQHDMYGEVIVTIGYEDTLDLAYKQAKKIYEAFAK